jgi:hypothetical protein
VGGTCGTHGGGERCLQGFGWEARKVGDHWEDLGVGGRITLSWTLEDRDQWGKLDSAGSGYGPVVGVCEHGDEPSGSIKKAGYFLIS